MFQSQHQNQPQAKRQTSYYLILSQPLPHDIIAQRRGVDVILSTEGGKEHTQAKLLSRQFVKKVVSVDSTGFYYPLSVPVKANE